MLSQTFERSVKQLLELKCNASKYEETLPNNNYYQISNGYASILMLLIKIEQIITGANDQNSFTNNIRNGILGNDVVNSGTLYPHYLQNLKQLDYMTQENQNKINQCLQSLNINYVLNHNLYEQIKTKTKLEYNNYERLILEIHFKVMIHKVFFVWKSDPTLFLPDIMAYNNIISKYDRTFIPLDDYLKTSSVILNILDRSVNIDDVSKLFKFIESLIMKYAEIKIIKNVIVNKFVKSNDTKKPSVKKVEIDAPNVSETKKVETSAPKVKKVSDTKKPKTTATVLRNVSDAKKKMVAGKQFFKCANTPNSNIERLESYDCPLWKIVGKNAGSFDESGYDIDHIVEHSLTMDDSIDNLQALCKMCHSVKTKRFLIKDVSKNKSGDVVTKSSKK